MEPLKKRLIISAIFIGITVYTIFFAPNELFVLVVCAFTFFGLGEFLELAKKKGVEKLTPARSLVAELVRRYWILGMELLATVDWLIAREGCEPTVEAVMQGMGHWPAGARWAERKVKLFDQRSIGIALDRLQSVNL